MSTIAAEAVKFHLSLNVTDLSRAIAFYRVLFGVAPAKVRADYAKFEIDEPPVIMSLIPMARGTGGALNHVGLRLLDSETLVAMQVRLEQAGYATQREEGVECCYSKQTKFWVTDPDRTLWELYILHGDADEHEHSASAEHGAAGNSTLRTEGLQLPVLPQPPAAAPVERIVWQHMLTQPLPESIDQADDSVDDVQLHGTLNMRTEPAALQRLLNEIHRVLKPGGTVFAHVLTADRPLAERPSLPGPAALVEFVPTAAAAAANFEAVGFAEVRFTKLAEKACFVVGETELRETNSRRPSRSPQPRPVVANRLSRCSIAARFVRSPTITATRSCAASGSKSPPLPPKHCEHACPMRLLS